MKIISWFSERTEVRWVTKLYVSTFWEALVQWAGKNSVNGSPGRCGGVGYSKMPHRALCLECQTEFSARRQQSNGG